MAKKMRPDILTAKEAARYVRLTLPTFYRYIWEGHIQAPKVGRRYRFTKASLDRWLGNKPSAVTNVSGRNKLVGRVTAIKRDTIMAQVDLDIGTHKITAVITRDALDELGLHTGKTAIALIKATEVMIVRE